MRSLTQAMVAVAMSMTGVSAFAHHSFAMFDPNRTLTLHGEVKEFRWTNPHAFIQLLATGEAGIAAGEWSIEMSSPEHLARAGWKPRVLKGGDRIVIVIHPLRDGASGGQFLSGTGPDGAPLGGAPRAAASAGVGK